MCVCVCLHEILCPMWMQMAFEAEDLGIPWSQSFRKLWATWYGCWKLSKRSLLEEQQVLLSTDPIFKHLLESIYFFFLNWLWIPVVILIIIKKESKICGKILLIILFLFTQAYVSVFECVRMWHDMHLELQDNLCKLIFCLTWSSKHQIQFTWLRGKYPYLLITNDWLY